MSGVQDQSVDDVTKYLLKKIGLHNVANRPHSRFTTFRGGVTTIEASTNLCQAANRSRAARQQPPAKVLLTPVPAVGTAQFGAEPWALPRVLLFLRPPFPLPVSGPKVISLSEENADGEANLREFWRRPWYSSLASSGRRWSFCDRAASAAVVKVTSALILPDAS